jgi:hypothetical protein
MCYTKMGTYVDINRGSILDCPASISPSEEGKMQNISVTVHIRDDTENGACVSETFQRRKLYYVLMIISVVTTIVVTFISLFTAKAFVDRLVGTSHNASYPSTMQYYNETTIREVLYWPVTTLMFNDIYYAITCIIILLLNLTTLLCGYYLTF